MAVAEARIEKTRDSGGGWRRAAMPWLLILPAFIITMLLLVVPLGYLVVVSFTDKSSFLFVPVYTAANYVTIFTEQNILIFETIKQAAGSVVIDLMFGFPFAYFLVRKVRYRDLVRALMAFPLFGTLYLAFGMRFILLPDATVGKLLVAVGLNPMSFLYSTPTVMFALAVGTFPFMVVSIATALQNVEVTLEEAAAALGANGWHTFTRVLLPMTSSGILAGSLLCFGWNLGVYIVPLLLGAQGDTRVLAVTMYIRGVINNDYGMAAAQGIILMVLATVVTYISLRFSRGALAS